MNGSDGVGFTSSCGAGSITSASKANPRDAVVSERTPHRRLRFDAIRIGRYGATSGLLRIGIVLLLFPSFASADPLKLDIQTNTTGIYSLRECTIIFEPSLTLGDNSAPRLTLHTSGTDNIEVSVENRDAFSEPTIVRNNVRSAFEFFSGTVQTFPKSLVGNALLTRTTFFVTAKQTSGKYVSSRYDRADINFDSILDKISAQCPLDVEPLMSGLAGRLGAEQALNLSEDDITMIRWVLLRKYENQQDKPESAGFFSASDRNYIKRYALENGGPVSGYLTAALSKQLLSEAANLATAVASSPPPAAPDTHSDYFTFHLCNKSHVTIAMATASRTDPTEDTLVVQGWGVVKKGECVDFGPYPKGWFYFYGEQKDSGRRYWGTNEMTLCVKHPGPFRRINTPGYTCNSSDLKGFYKYFIAPDEDTFSFDMNP